jgi:acyl carrier protein
VDESEIWQRLREVFVRFFDAPGLALSRSTTAEDVDGWDSLANVELMVELEQAFGIRFRTGEVAELEDVGQLVDLIARHVRV